MLQNTTPHKSWPENFGFWIYGQGPTYVVFVEKNSVAEKSGINAGDKIVELDNEDVSELSDNLIRLMANNSRNNPPYIGVQSVLREVDLIRTYSKTDPFGFKMHDISPVIVDDVEIDGPAYLAGLKKGDIIINVNNIPINNSNNLKSILDNYNGQVLKIKFIPISEDKMNFFLKNTSLNPNEKLQGFYGVVNKFFLNDTKKNFVLNEIAHYNEKGDVNSLVANLNKVLKTSEERSFFNHLKPLIPPSHQKTFESLINKESNYTNYSNGAVGFKKTKSSLEELAAMEHLKNQEKRSVLINQNMERDIKPSRRSRSRKDRSSSRSSSESSDERKKHRNSFCDKMDEVLSKSEKRKLKMFICDYLKTKDLDEFYCNADKILDTRSKKSLWNYIVQIMDKNHQKRLKEYLTKRSRSRSRSRSKRDHCLTTENIVKKESQRPKIYLIEKCEPCEPREPRCCLKSKSKIYSSMPSLYFDDECQREDEKKVSLLMEQLEYYLNMNERCYLKQVLKEYNKNRNFCVFLYKINRILDTPAKRSIWLNIVSVLDEKDQEFARHEYCKMIRNKNDLNKTLSKKYDKCFVQANLKNAKFCKSSINLDTDYDSKLKAKSLFRWEPDSEDECSLRGSKLNFVESEYSFYDTDSEFYETEETNIEYELEGLSSDFDNKVIIKGSKKCHDIPIYLKSTSSLNKF